MSDGFLMALLASTPLVSTAAFPYVPRPISNVCLAVTALVVVNWVAVPLGRWAWLRLRANAFPRLLTARYSRPR